MAANTVNRFNRFASVCDALKIAIAPLLLDNPGLLAKVQAIVEETATIKPAETIPSGPIQMRVTPTVQRNFKMRGVFPQYSLELASKILAPMTGIFWVATEAAEAVMRDADEQLLGGNIHRGTATAFRCLSKALGQELKNEKFRGCVEFPGVEQVKAMSSAASAIFQIGDRVDSWNFDGVSVSQVTIIKKFDTYQVKDTDGPYVHGEWRVECRPGYVVKADGDDTYFCRAGDLSQIGKSYGHLRLVN